MTSERRSVLATGCALLLAGCSTPDGGSTDVDTTTRPGDTPTCDPADVDRPPVVTGGDIEGREYPRKPDELTTGSVAEYADEFETAFAWNRVLETQTVNSVNVDVLAAFQADETGDGFLAAGELAVSFTTDDGETTDRRYVANYFVTPEPVYRTETEREQETPAPAEASRLVQCGPESDGK